MKVLQNISSLIWQKKNKNKTKENMAFFLPWSKEFGIAKRIILDHKKYNDKPMLDVGECDKTL